MYSQDCLVYGIVRHSFHVLLKKEFLEHLRKNVVFATVTVLWGICDVLVLYSTLFHLPPLRFHWAGECWDWTQDCCDQWRSILIDCMENVPFFRLFTSEGDMEYTGCGNTEYRGLKAIVLPWLPSCSDKLEKKCAWSCFVLWWKLERACHTQGLSKNAHLQATVNYSCLCSLHFVMLITIAKPCQNSVKSLCGMESSKMPFWHWLAVRRYNH